VFFQWEIDARDGKKLKIAASGQTANVSYGIWNSRESDVLHEDVSFPFVLDPQADGLSSADGEYYVVKIEFLRRPESDIPVEVKAIR